MAKGLKLYDEFKALISEVGEVKIAWFTTFNLSLDFFEKYILSALVSIDPFNVRNLKDFEALNDRIINAENGSMDVKVFHDYRAIRPDVKKTCIQTIGINPKNIDTEFTNGVFHPKVALIVNAEDEAWIVTGSANLSLSAWSKNSECLVIKKIEDQRNAESITDFFIDLLPSRAERDKLRSINSNWQHNLKPDDNWKFINSLAKDKLLDYINHQYTAEMMVWSPYFSEDFAELIEKHLSNIIELKVIPDLTDAGTVRMTPEGLKSALANPSLSMQKDLQNDHTENLVHAKVWVTPNTIAIGSWNFSKAGLNLSINANNIEAGIVEEIDHNSYQEFKKSCKLTKLEQPEGMAKEDLEDEKKDLLNNWSISCQIYADWSTYQYQLQSEEDLSNQKLYIDLPGKKSRISLQQFSDDGVDFSREYKSLLKDRLFTIYDKKEDGNKVYLGVIIELNPIERPSVGFDSLDDLLRAWSDGRPESKTQFHQMNFDADTESGEELSDKITKALKGDYSNAWFTMFLAFEQFRARLEAAKGDKRELKILGYRIPGSVVQLNEHLTLLKTEIDTKENDMSRSFIWFMINEGNQVITLFNNFYEDGKMSKIERIENIELDFNQVSKRKMTKWLKYIKESCSY